jgi:hypothetical protein
LVVIAAVLGPLNPTVALFVTVILWGVLVSMLSIYLAERDTSYFSQRQVLLLIWFGVLENYGFRQLSSSWRATGFVRALRKPKGGVP